MSERQVPRAVADLERGVVLACVELEASPERVFQALTTEEVVQWWGDAQTFRTTRWSADLRAGGQWQAEGVDAQGHPFVLRGTYIEVDPPRRIVTSWIASWEAGLETTLTYLVDPTATGARLTVRHEGFSAHRHICEHRAGGWERVLGWLVHHLRQSSK